MQARINSVKGNTMTPEGKIYARKYWKLADERGRVEAFVATRLARLDALMVVERNAYAGTEGFDPADNSWTVEIPALARSGRPKADASE